MKSINTPTPSDKDQLRQILAILKRYEDMIGDALDEDSEVTLGGNGINCCEANSTFRPLAEEIRSVINGD